MKPARIGPHVKGSQIRNLPFFLSRRFLLFFGAASLVMVPLSLQTHSGLYAAIAANVLLFLAALLDFLRCPAPQQVHLERPVPYPLAVDRPNEIFLEVANRTGRPVDIRVQDDVPDHCTTQSFPLVSRLGIGSQIRLSYHLTPLVRGDAEFGDIHFWVRGPMGLVWRHGHCSAASPVKLYPGLALIERARMRSHPLSTHHMVWPISKTGEGTEFDCLREYVVGDDSRLIHWGTTARRGKPIIRHNRVERGQTIFLVLDAGRMMTARVQGKSKFDHSLNAALLLSYAALEAGDKVGFMIVGREVVRFLAPSNVKTHFGRIIDAAYSVEPEMEEPRFYLAVAELSAKLKRRSLVVVFTDLIDERASRGLLRYGLALMPRHLPLVVAMWDSEVVRVADETPRDKVDLYRQGVAAEILERRARLLARLESSGVLVVDTPPEKISVSLLHRYLEIKKRTLL